MMANNSCRQNGELSCLLATTSCHARERCLNGYANGLVRRHFPGARTSARRPLQRSSMHRRSPEDCRGPSIIPDCRLQRPCTAARGWPVPCAGESLLSASCGVGVDVTLAVAGSVSCVARRYPEMRAWPERRDSVECCTSEWRQYGAIRKLTRN